MQQWLRKTNAFLYNDFLFLQQFRWLRHISYWLIQVTVWAVFWYTMGDAGFLRVWINMLLWVPCFVAFGYPLAYIAIPRLLLAGELGRFFILILTWGTVGLVAWGAVGLYLNPWYRDFIYNPIQQFIGIDFIPSNALQVHSYLCMTTSAASLMIIRFFKLWTIKQNDWMLAEEEKVKAELQLLKAQVHPHFLFNSLNNIYNAASVSSAKTPALILKLSSLLSYILYDCKTEEVRLDRELEVMKNYVDLEQERCGDELEVSWSVEGETEGAFIAPLLLMPFLENACKHGISPQLEKSWLSVDISVKDQVFLCKIVNSKLEFVKASLHDTGVRNVQKRLDFLYPGRHQLKRDDEGNFYIVSLRIQLGIERKTPVISVVSNQHLETKPYEAPLPAYR